MPLYNVSAEGPFQNMTAQSRTRVSQQTSLEWTPYTSSCSRCPGLYFSWTEIEVLSQRNLCSTGQKKSKSAKEEDTCYEEEKAASILLPLSRIQLFVTLYTVTCQAPLSKGFSRQKYWRGLLSPAPGDLPGSRVKPASPWLAGRFFTTEPRKPFVAQRGRKSFGSYHERYLKASGERWHFNLDLALRKNIPSKRSIHIWRGEIRPVFLKCELEK